MLIAASLPLSKFTMSITEFLLLALWFWSGFSFKIALRFFKIGGFFSGIYHLFAYLIKLLIRNFTDKFELFFRNKAAVIFTSLFFIHILGLINTSDFDYALKDLRIKIPLLLFPVVLSTMETLKYKQFRLLMLFYIAAVFSGTMISLGLIVQGEFTDIRFTSPYIGSIRFGLNVSFAFFALIYFIFFDHWFKLWQKVLFVLIGAWFFVYLIMLESVTSLSAIVLISLLYMIFMVFRIRKLSVKISILFVIFALPTLIFYYIFSTIHHASTPPQIFSSQLDKKTIDGNPYIHDTINRGVEDGRYLGLYLCEVEMKDAWNRRSSIDYEAFPEGKYEVKETLIRYLTSKDLRKDQSGVNALTEKDIRLIEQGVANYHYVAEPGIRVRILKIMMGYEVYKKTGDPSGSSVMQRIEYSKAAIDLIKKHFWFGVGTGDIENILIDQYKKMDSGLKTQFMFHAHNQFLAVFITFGVFGFLWFIFLLIYPAYKLNRFSDFFFATFFLIMVWSMLSDDTLETQAGVTLFAFFFSLLLFGKEKKNA